MRDSNYWGTKIVWDSAKNMARSKQLQVAADMDIISFANMQTDINNSYNKWKLYLWNKELDFNDFNEYVLPFRVAEERISNVDWRTILAQKYSWVRDSITDETSATEAVTLINNDLKRWFSHHDYFSQYPGGLSIETMLAGRKGNCRDMANLAAYTMRSLGIPVSHDYTPQWGNLGKGHSWNAIILPDGNSVKFMGAESSPGEKSVYWDREKPAKIFRYNYSKTNKLYEYLSDVEIPTYLRNKCVSDVTKEYVEVSNLKIRPQAPSHNDTRSSIGFIAIFNNRDWMPIYWGEISEGEVIFKDMGRDIVYLPVYINKSSLQAFNDPIILKKDGTTQTLNPDISNTITINLNRKYPLFPRIEMFAKKMTNAKFEASNSSVFKNTVVLHKIEKEPTQFWNRVQVSADKKFRYVRYSANTSIDQGIAEIEVYDKNGNQIQGKSLVTNPIEKQYAFDGDWSTFAGDSLITIDFEEAIEVAEIRFIPRTDANMIKPGDRYELFFWNKGTWQSLGSKVAENATITFSKVPSNALFWLRNFSGGREERIFTYENGMQVWW